MFLCESIIVFQCNHSKSKIMFYLYDIKTDFGKKEVKQAHLNLPSGELKSNGYVHTNTTFNVLMVYRINIKI